VAWDGPAYLPVWAARSGHDLSVCLVPERSELPPSEDYDALIIMGGPMSLWEHERYPWLTSEKRYLEAVLRRGIPFLGICLGAQLLADVHGAPVRRGRHREIGWFPLDLIAERRGTWLGDALPEALEAFFWHDDVFETPRGATRVAATAANPHQAFVIGSAAGLQFHLEVTPEWAAHLVRRDGDQLRPDSYVQSAAEILGRSPASYARSHAALGRVLGGWLRQDAVWRPAPLPSARVPGDRRA
jgi:GMP synthase-like glutamine amidotransferase